VHFTSKLKGDIKVQVKYASTLFIKPNSTLCVCETRNIKMSRQKTVMQICLFVSPWPNVLPESLHFW